MKSGPHVLKRNARGYEEEQDQTGLERFARSTLERNSLERFYKCPRGSRSRPTRSQEVKGMPSGVGLGGVRCPIGSTATFDGSSDDLKGS